MRKLLLFFNSFLLTTCSTLGLSNLSQQEKNLKISTPENEKTIENEGLSPTEKIFKFVLENQLSNYTNESIFRIYSTAELELINLDNVTKAIEKKLFVLTGGHNLKIKILNEKDIKLTAGINKKIEVEVKFVVDHYLINRTFDLLINLEQSSDLQQLIVIRYLLEKPNILKSSLLWRPKLKNRTLSEQEVTELNLQLDEDFIVPIINSYVALASMLLGQQDLIQRYPLLDIPGLERPRLVLENSIRSVDLQRRNLLHEQWYYPLLGNIENKIHILDFFADLYTKEFNDYDEVIKYINNELKKSIWTKNMEVSWNKRFVPNNFFSANNNVNRMGIPMLNFINLDLRWNDSIAIKVTLQNLQSKTKIVVNFDSDFSVLDIFNNTLSLLSFEYINTLKTEEELVQVLNAIILKLLHPPRIDRNPNRWLTELLTDISSNPDFNDSQIRETLLAKLCNDQHARILVRLRNTNVNCDLIDGENILQLKLAPNESAAEVDWIDYDLLINWNMEKEKYHYQHEILYKYIIDLERNSRELENIHDLTEENNQSDLLQTIQEDIEDYYQNIKNNEIPTLLEGNNLIACKKDIYLMCYKNTFFDTNLPLPIKFLNPNIVLKKGNNDILVEVSLDNYRIEFRYSINI